MLDATQKTQCDSGSISVWCNDHRLIINSDKSGNLTRICFRSYYIVRFHKAYAQLLIVPIHFGGGGGGGGGLYTQTGFFVQSIFADPCIHQRELSVVSLENPSSVEYISKKTFLKFSTELSRFKIL